jgi:AcrR family transcriptional regulator
MATAHSGSGDIARTLELLWRGGEPTRPGPRPVLALEQIVRAAVALADSEGLGAVSMRRVAAELGVGTMSLYRYVPGKGELLDLMLDLVNQLPDSTKRLSGKPWRTVLEQVALGAWDLYLSHPWLLQVNQTRPLLGPNALAGFDFALGALAGLDLTGREKVAVIIAVDHYVTGTARTYLLQQEVAQESGVTDEDFWAAQEPVLIDAMATGNYPEVARLPEDAFSIGGREALEFGLRTLLDGFEALVVSRSAKT